IFSVVTGVLLRPLSYPDAERLLVIKETQLPEFPEFSVAPPNFLDWEKQTKSFARLAAYRRQNYNLTGSGEPIRVTGLRVTSGFFSTYGVAPLLGRDFRPEEDTVATGNVVILSYAFWQRQFGGDPAVLNQTVQLNGQPCQVLGVMPADFQRSGTAELWAPMAFRDDERDNDNRGAHYINVVARLKAGVSLEQAQAEMNVLAEQFAKQYPDSNKGWGIKLFSLPAYTVRDVKVVLYTLLGAVGCVLLIACANIANLLLARGTARLREVSIRAALGAGRGRIIRQLLTESVLLAVLGGLLGMLVAKWGLDALLAFAPANLPRIKELGLDPTALGFALALSVVTGLVFGVAPAWLATGHDLNTALKDASRGSTESGHRAWFRHGLVVAEVALALLLLTGAGLLVRSFIKLSGVNPGFEPANATVVNISLPNGRYGKPEQQSAFAEQLLAHLRTLPGVKAAGLTHVLPLEGDWVLGFTIDGRPPIAPSDLPNTNYYAVTPDYFRAMGIRLVRGRLFTERDDAKAAHVAVINETLARQHFPNEDPIGKRINITNGPDTWREIVGIVSDVRQYGVDRPTTNQAYEPFAQKPYGSITAVVRTEGDGRALYSSLRAEVFAVDKDQPVSSIRALSEILADTISRQRFAMLLLTVFSVVALVISAIGIYGVMAYSVSQRTSEIGIRMALGASARDVLRMILRQGMAVIGLGLAVGLVAAIAATRVVASILYQTSPRDPLTLALIALALGGVAFIACLIPALRATRIDPLSALRAE
ncbi:MAG TPA: ABC transporter permease, partial [Candidatus Didemnitutus sp.]|nr:ABC transporter permease [Candidatus Didemnitutus sp.]